jgi:hypothetical protein
MTSVVPALTSLPVLRFEANKPEIEFNQETGMSASGQGPASWVATQVPRSGYDFFFPPFFSVVDEVPVAGAFDVAVPLVLVMPVPVVPVVPVIVVPVVAVVDIVPVVPVAEVSVAVVIVVVVATVSVAVVTVVLVIAVSVFVFSSFLQETANRASATITTSVRTNDFFMR